MFSDRAPVPACKHVCMHKGCWSSADFLVLTQKSHCKGTPPVGGRWGFVPCKQFVCLHAHIQPQALQHFPSCQPVWASSDGIITENNAKTCLMSDLHQWLTHGPQLVPSSTDTGQQVPTWVPTPFGKVSLPSQKLICSWGLWQETNSTLTLMHLSIDTTTAMATLLPHTSVSYQTTGNWEQETLSCCAAAENPWTPRSSKSPGAGEKPRQLQCLSL